MTDRDILKQIDSTEAAGGRVRDALNNLKNTFTSTPRNGASDYVKANQTQAAADPRNPARPINIVCADIDATLQRIDGFEHEIEFERARLMQLNAELAQLCADVDQHTASVRARYLQRATTVSDATRSLLEQENRNEQTHSDPVCAPAAEFAGTGEALRSND